MFFLRPSERTQQEHAMQLLGHLLAQALPPPPSPFTPSQFLRGFPAAQASQLPSGLEVFTDFNKALTAIEVSKLDVSANPKFLGACHVLQVKNSNGLFFLPSVISEIRSYIDAQFIQLQKAGSEDSQRVVAERIQKTWEAVGAIRCQLDSLKQAASDVRNTWGAWAVSFFSSSYEKEKALFDSAIADLSELEQCFIAISSQVSLVQPPRR